MVAVNKEATEPRVPNGQVETCSHHFESLTVAIVTLLTVKEYLSQITMNNMFYLL